MAINFESVIVFSGPSEFKKEVSPNVINSSQFIKYVRSQSKEVLDDSFLDQLVEELEDYILENNRENIKRHREHVKNIIERKNA